MVIVGFVAKAKYSTVHDDRSVDRAKSLHAKLVEAGVFDAAEEVFDAVERGDDPFGDAVDLADVLRQAEHLR